MLSFFESQLNFQNPKTTRRLLFTSINFARSSYELFYIHFINTCIFYVAEKVEVIQKVRVALKIRNNPLGMYFENSQILAAENHQIRPSL